MKLCVMLVLLAACSSPDKSVSSSRLAAKDLAIVVENNQTQPAYNFAEAIKETVYVEADMDSDADGAKDKIAVDIVRPRETNDGLKASVIMEASPYYFANPEELPPSAGDRQIPHGFYGWYDEYFVPRGYATVEVEMQGTSRSMGCPTTGGPEDTKSIVAVIDWLNGRATAKYKDGTPAVAAWSTGNVGMIGVSYNGTLPIAVATQGTPGLKTIVPIAAISNWYDYTRDQGIGFYGWDRRYPQYLANYVISVSGRQRCDAQLRALGDDAGDSTFDFTPFWQARDYRKDAANVTASVFMVHGQEDWNVKPHNFSRFWYLLQERNVPRKLWLHREAHTDPVRINSELWKQTMHRWFDHWLYDLDNGVMADAMTTIQRPNGTLETHNSWPEEGTTVVSYYPNANSSLSATASPPATQSMIDDTTQLEDVKIANPLEQKNSRLAYLTPPLTAPLRISGTARFHARLTPSSVSSPVVALLIDYGDSASPQPLNHDPIALMTESCTLADLTHRTGCALPDDREDVLVSKRVVSRGAIDLKNATSLEEGTRLEPGVPVEVEFDLQPKDYVFPVGHQLGLVLTINDGDYVTIDALARTLVLDLDASALLLPVAP